MANAEQIALLEEGLRTIEWVQKTKKAFDIQNWLKHRPSNTNVKPAKDDYCGTVGCGIGYMALNPVLSAAGLKLAVSFSKNYNYVELCVGTIEDFNKLAHRPDVRVYGVTPVFVKNKKVVGDSYFGIAAFFGISFDKADWLFSPSRYSEDQFDKPATMIKRLKKLIKNEKAALVTSKP